MTRRASKTPLKVAEKVWKVYKNEEYKTGGCDFRLESWIVNGKHWPCRLVRRDYFLAGETGARKTGKAKGLTEEDMGFVIENGPEIKADMARANDEIKKQKTESTPGNEPVLAESWNS